MIVSDSAILFCCCFYAGDEADNAWRGRCMFGVFLFVSDAALLFVIAHAVVRSFLIRSYFFNADKTHNTWRGRCMSDAFLLLF